VSPALAIAQRPGDRPGQGVSQAARVSLLASEPGVVGPAGAVGRAGHGALLLWALVAMELPLGGKPSVETGWRAALQASSACGAGLPGELGVGSLRPRVPGSDPGPAAALGVGAGPAAPGAVQGQGQSRDPVDGSPQGSDFGKPFAAEVVFEGQPQGVEGLVVVQDPLALSDVGSHPPGLGAHRPAPLAHLRPFGVPQEGGCFHLPGDPQTLPVARLRCGPRFQLLFRAVGLGRCACPRGCSGHGRGEGEREDVLLWSCLPRGVGDTPAGTRSRL